VIWFGHHFSLGGGAFIIAVPRWEAASLSGGKLSTANRLSADHIKECLATNYTNWHELGSRGKAGVERSMNIDDSQGQANNSCGPCSQDSRIGIACTKKGMKLALHPRVVLYVQINPDR
jgi:hypothetical protein